MLCGKKKSLTESNVDWLACLMTSDSTMTSTSFLANGTISLPWSRLNCTLTTSVVMLSGIFIDERYPADLRFYRTFNVLMMFQCWAMCFQRASESRRDCMIQL